MLRRLLQLQNTGYQVNIGDIFGKAWSLVSQQIGLHLLFTLLFIIAFFVGAIIPFASIFIVPMSFMAYWTVFNETRRGNNVSFNTFFEGFSTPNFVNTIITYVVQNMVVFLAVLVLFIPSIIYLVFNIAIIDDLDNMKEPPVGLILIFSLTFLAILIASVYFSIAYLLAMPVIFFSEEHTGWWELMENSRKVVNKSWFMLWIMSILMSIVCFFAILFTLGLGLFVIIPWAYAVHYTIFEQIVGFDADETAKDDNITQHFVV